MDFDLRGELQIGSTWVDTTGKILKRQSLTHTRGRPDQGARVDPSTCRPLLNNTDGRLSPDNPTGPYYGQFGRNTPFRFSVAAGSTSLVTTGTTGDDRARTADAPSLDITGDIDIRLEASFPSWRSSPVLELAGKWDFPNQKSWMLTVWNNGLLLWWSPDGTTEVLAASTQLTEPPSGQMAIRVTLDVDNGASGRTATFYTATSISGPWVQLGSPVITAGTTSIFSSTASVDVGAVSSVAFADSVGRFHAFQLRNGINGTLVASPDFTAQTPGATSFVDGAGRTWTLGGNASITNRRTRLSHELAAYPTEWHPSGAHAWVDAQTAGILRRLRRGNHALDSTLRRRIPSGAPLAYWPLEDGRNATQFYSPIPGVRPITTSGMDLASDDSLAGSNALPTVRSSSKLSGSVPAPSGSPTQWHGEFIYYLPNTGPATARTVLTWSGTGTVQSWRLMIKTNGSEVYGYDADNTVITSANVDLTGTGAFNAWTRWQLIAKQNGSSVDWSVAWVPIGAAGTQVTTSYTGTVGRITGVAGGGYHSDLDGMRLGHIAAFSSETFIYNSADIGFAGETAGTRMQRLAAEEGLTLTVCGVVSEQALVGAQRPNGVLDLLEEAADADGGILYEDRDRAALRYRDRAGMYNQEPVLALDYNGPGLAPPLKPTGDDDATQNDVTVTRVGGSSARAVLEEGPMSIQAPPNGVGIGYDTSVDLNLYSDEQTEQHAHWRLHLGTYEGRRYPQVRVMVHKAPAALLDQILAVDVGDKIVIQNPPIWVAPGDIELIVQGYEETWRSEREWDIVFNCTPGQPWTVGVVGDGTRARADTAGSELATAVTSTDTALHLLTTAQQRWVTTAIRPAAFPFALRLGGEVVTATACTSWLADAFGRTVSNAWGTPDTGPAWTTAGGSASDFSVGSGYGVHVLSTVDVTRRTAVTAVHPDFDLYCDITTSALATGDSLYGAVTARMLDSGNMYLLRVAFTTSNTVIAEIRKIVADVQTSLGTYTLPGVTHAAGTFIRVRFQGKSSTLRAKAWPAAQPEVDVWNITATDTSITAANSIGTRSIRTASNTNAATVAIRYDTYQVVNPQTATATRSVNGIVKAQAAGTGVRLATPCIVPL